MVSIITPSFNSAQFIAHCIESVIAQTYTNWEMIIVDDVSPDNANQIIEEYITQDSRIKLIKLAQNSGPAIARNSAINEASGNYIAFLDSDDIWLPRKLETQIAFMKKNDISLSYGSYEVIDQGGELLSTKEPPNTLTYEELLKENQIGCLTAVYNRRKLGKIYMPIIDKRQDYGLWLQILQKVSKAYKIPGILAQYRILDDSISSNKLGLLKYNYILFREIEGFSIVKASYYVCWNIFRKII